MLTQEDMLALFRDMTTALDVGKKAEMGYYDVEFNAFGCAYFNREERNYRVSASAAKIYDYLEYAALDNLYPTTIITATFKKPIPNGLKDMLSLDLKRDLAQTMCQNFSFSFLQALQQLAETIKQNNACELLNSYMDTLECTFQREQFDLFEHTLVMAVTHRKLAQKDYQLLIQRLNNERQNLSNDLHPHDLFHQTFYAFTYGFNEEQQYIFDARKEFVYKKRYQLETQGAIVSPLLSKTCFYNYNYRLTDARKDFSHNLPGIFSPRYFELLRALKALPAAISRDCFLQTTTDFTRLYGPSVKNTLTMYGYLWDIM